MDKICKNLTARDAADEFICSACGIQLVGYVKYDPEAAVHYSEFIPSYCPKCGAKVKHFLPFRSDVWTTWE